MLGVQQRLGQFGQRLSQVLAVERLHVRVFMREAQVCDLVQSVQYRTAAVCQLFAVVDGLTAAACTAARTCHDLDKVIPDTLFAHGLDQSTGIAQSADHCNMNGRACDVKIGFTPALVTAHIAESIGRRILAGNHVISGTQRGFHNTAGRTKDHARTGARAERRVARLLGQILDVDLIGTQHAVDFTCGQYQIDVLAVVLILHGAEIALGLFRQAGHDRDAEQFLGINADLLGKPSLGRCTEHLLRRFG